VFKEGQNLVQIKLSETLDKLVYTRDPFKLFYKAFIAQNIIHDMKEAAKECNLTGVQLTNKLVLFKLLSIIIICFLQRNNNFGRLQNL
jgi:hypothetical protein